MKGKSRLHPAALLVSMLLAGFFAVAAPAGAHGTFGDDDGNLHEGAIEEIAALGITRGCNPPQNDLYCPSQEVTREQMAAFLVRALGLTESGDATFVDDDDSVFETDIERLAAAGITRGCDPPTNTRFCPDEPVTRGEMAAFLVRALGLTAPGQDTFVDDDGSVFETDIELLAAAGITRGCNPPENTRFCPDAPVRRDAMATFLSRAHDLHTAGVPTTSTTMPGPSSSVTSSSTLPPGTTPSTAPTSTTTTLPLDGLDLRVVSDPGRHNERPLSGAHLAGNIFVVARPQSGLTVDEIRFWIDDPSRAQPPAATEGAGPWDLAGTAADGTALPWNTAGGDTELSEGLHTITAAAFDAGNEVATSSATFTVDNAPATTEQPDQVHLSWAADSATTMTVVWRTVSEETAAQIRWRPAGTSTWTTVAGEEDPDLATGLHLATATGLSPATEYEFQVAADGGGWSSTRSFRTAPPEGGTFDAIYFADTGLAGRTDGLAVGVLQSVTAMDALDADLLLPGGDYAYNATGQCDQSDGRFDTDEAGLNQAIDQWFRQMDPLINDTPMMPTYGNHEVLLCEGFDEWADRFATPKGVAGPDVSPDPPVDARGTYSFEVGDVHFISMTAVHESSGISATQLGWLESDIQGAIADGAQWIVPYFHATPFSHGTNHDTNPALRDQLAPLFEQYDIPLVLFSHDQSYERSYPLTGLAGGDPDTESDSKTCYTESNPGVVWLKVSPSGKHSNKSLSFSPWQTAPPSWVAESDNTRHHFTRVTASPDKLRVRTYGHDALGSGATVIDDFSITTGSCG